MVTAIIKATKEFVKLGGIKESDHKPCERREMKLMSRNLESSSATQRNKNTV